MKFTIKIARDILSCARDLIAVDFDSQEALDKYLKKHPKAKANSKNHKVKKDIQLDVGCLPRIAVIITKKNNTALKDLNAIHFDLQRFVSTLSHNEDLRYIVSRAENNTSMELVISFDNHEAMNGIVSKIMSKLKTFSKNYKLDFSIILYNEDQGC